MTQGKGSGLRDFWGSDSAKTAKFMQGMQPLEAGIPEGENEYNQKAEAVHTPVVIRGRFSTCYPIGQKQAGSGFEPVFHSFHTPYY